MFIYFSVILFCFLLSTIKLPKSIENSALLLIAFFLCFGYMTGTDWYLYEQYYNNEKLSEEIAKSREFGYFLLQNFIENLGIDFWIFHIAVKLISFYFLIKFIRYFNLNIFLFLAFFIPNVGLYLFIDCPFRNLIAFAFVLLAYNKLFENKTIHFFIYTAIAVSFHLSAFFAVIIYFIYKKEIKYSFAIASALIIYSVAFNIDFLVTNIYIPLTKAIPILDERLKGYFLDSHFTTNTINAGSFIRVLILIIFLVFKETIVNGDKIRSYIYNLSILYLLVYPLGISMKIIQRFLLFLSPFYTMSIIYLLTSMKVKGNKYILSLFFIAFSFWQTYSMITVDFRYIPYTNYMYYWAKRSLPDIKYRHHFNPTHSPYKKHSPQK